MRKWHRWLSVFFGVFLSWIALTGILIHLFPLFVGNPVPAPPRPGFVCPQDMTCRMKSPVTDDFITLLQLHGDGSMGLTGVIVSTLSGLALLFFATSGLWLYVRMWRNRNARKLKPGWFWK